MCIWPGGAGLASVLGLALYVWAMRVNTIFSGSVRMQFDRGHTVCSSGLYRYVRHPGYIGFGLYYGAMPLLLGSLWALLPDCVAGGLLATRTGLEDKTLLQKLPGHAEYASRVRYCLLPGLW